MNSDKLNKDIFYKSSDDLLVSSSLFTTSTPTKKGEYDKGSETSQINKKLMKIQNNLMDSDFIPNDSYGSTTFKKNTDGIIKQYGGGRKRASDSATIRVPLDTTDTVSTSAYTSSYTSSYTPSSYSLSSYTPSDYPSSYTMSITSSDIDDSSSSTNSSSVTDSKSDQDLDHKRSENKSNKIKPKSNQKSEGVIKNKKISKINHSDKNKKSHNDKPKNK